MPPEGITQPAAQKPKQSKLFSRKFGAQHVDPLDGGRLRQQIAGLGHQRFRNGPIQVSISSAFVIKSIEDSENRGAQLQREPHGS